MGKDRVVDLLRWRVVAFDRGRREGLRQFTTDENDTRREGVIIEIMAWSMQPSGRSLPVHDMSVMLLSKG
jgi:hypothetical protein